MMYFSEKLKGRAFITNDDRIIEFGEMVLGNSIDRFGYKTTSKTVEAIIIYKLNPDTDEFEYMDHFLASNMLAAFTDTGFVRATNSAGGKDLLSVAITNNGESTHFREIGVEDPELFTLYGFDGFVKCNLLEPVEVNQ